MSSWSTCFECKGRGKRSKGLRKNVRFSYQKALEQFEKSDGTGPAPIPPKGHLYVCSICSGTGLLPSVSPPVADKENYPHVAIIGGGIAGVALAVACLHRAIPFTLFERDNGFDVRAQGYGLTVQQATIALEGLGVFPLAEGVFSTRHVVHNTEGKILGEWGLRKWMPHNTKNPPKRTNMLVARQSLRMALIKQLGGEDVVQWGHQLLDFKEHESGGVELRFTVHGEIKSVHADLVVGSDGIRSSVRKLALGEDVKPLRYLGCIVILGICKLEDLKEVDKTLLDSATIFQTVNGNDRIYVMPYDKESVMWQFSFPLLEEEAKHLSAQGAKALKEEVCRRANWHQPIPQILFTTKEANVIGYPVYDREMLTADLLTNMGSVTLIGDAAHPMSPFKGQGANQALLDALALARQISKGCRPHSGWRAQGIRKSVLRAFETEMLERTSSKVKDSREAAMFLHSDIAMHEGDEPRGQFLKRKDS
jgi:2-polyprenyl-6-methoxyphenol hydroxylase-like FAD-dependent oxidoreductase